MSRLVRPTNAGGEAADAGPRAACRQRTDLQSPHIFNASYPFGGRHLRLVPSYVMTAPQRISANAIAALKDALTAAFWFKRDLYNYAKAAVGGEPTFLAGIDWT